MEQIWRGQLAFEGVAGEVLQSQRRAARLCRSVLAAVMMNVLANLWDPLTRTPTNNE